MVRMPLKAALWPCLLLTIASAADPAGAETVRLCSDIVKKPPEESILRPVEGGLRAYVDPETGELLDGPPPGQRVESGDTPATAGQAQRAGEPNEKGLKVTVAPNGMRVIELGDRFLTELHAEMIDGKLVTCHRYVPGMRAGEVDSAQENSTEAVSNEDVLHAPDH